MRAAGLPPAILGFAMVVCARRSLSYLSAALVLLVTLVASKDASAIGFGVAAIATAFWTVRTLERRDGAARLRRDEIREAGVAPPAAPPEKPSSAAAQRVG